MDIMQKTAVIDIVISVKPNISMRGKDDDRNKIIIRYLKKRAPNLTFVSVRQQKVLYRDANIKRILFRLEVKQRKYTKSFKKDKQEYYDFE